MKIEELGFSQDWWRTVADQAPMPLSVIDLDGRQVAWNAAYAELFGYSPGQLRLMTATSLTATRDKGRTGEYLTALASGCVQRVQVEKLYVRADGSEFPARLTASTLRDANGVSKGFVGFIEDLSERDTAIAVRSEMEVKFEKVLMALTELVCEWTPSGRILFMNDAYRAFFSMGDSALGRSLLDFIPEDGIPEQLVRMKQIGDGISGYRIVRRYPDGRTVAWNDTVLRDESGVAQSIMSVGRDVTERTRTEEMLRQAHRRQQLLLTSIYDSVLLLDVTGRPTATTGRVRNDLGYDSEFWATVDVFALAHPDDHGRLVQLWGRLVATPGLEMSTEARIRTADGRWVTVELDGVNNLHHPDVGAVVITARNIHRRKLAEESLARTHDEALERLRSRGELLAMLSTELHDPLHALRSLCSALLMSELDEQQRDLVVEIDRSLVKLARNTDRLLNPAADELEQAPLPPLPSMRVLLVERDAWELERLQATVTSFGVTALTCDSGAKALELLATQQIDVVLIGSRLADTDALTLSHSVRHRLAVGPGMIGLIPGASPSAAPATSLPHVEAGLNVVLPAAPTPVQLHAALSRFVPGVGPSPLDQTALDRLSVELGSLDTARAVVAQFVQELPSRREALIAAALASDLDAAQRVVHVLRPSALLLGATQLALACDELSFRGKLNQERVATIVTLARDVELALLAWVSSSPG